MSEFIPWILFVLILAAQLSDALTTLKILALGGSELNPILSRLMFWLGPKRALILVKGFVSVVALLICIAVKGTFAWFLLALLLVPFMVLTYLNLLVIRRLSGGKKHP
jgi:hypothetical protein